MSPMRVVVPFTCQQRKRWVGGWQVMLKQEKRTLLKMSTMQKAKPHHFLSVKRKQSARAGTFQPLKFKLKLLSVIVQILQVFVCLFHQQGTPHLVDFLCLSLHSVRMDLQWLVGELMRASWDPVCIAHTAVSLSLSLSLSCPVKGTYP